MLLAEHSDVGRSILAALENTGLGEDKLARYVDACRVLPSLYPPGELFSYCNVGFNLLGRMTATPETKA